MYNPLVYETDEDGNVRIVTEKDENGKTKIAYNETNKERALDVVEKMYEFGHICEAEYLIAVDELENNKIGLTISQNDKVYSYFTDAVYTQVLEDLQEELDLTSDEASEYLLNKGLSIYSTAVSYTHLAAPASSRESGPVRPCF